ncbi:hypothetical protein [Haloarcula sp. Atlit-7R]|uniref:hypothetical protein n=1 Tax=Haloarcula sp. Atlit-7R TaxID=2282125 RepID=UPI000EF13337|nr:hypothetical protein [Haloarcula sp. Atlit-7R]RLM90049.1 hypothetical protein D3D01_18315 [Haloarcula sp. Atlit-7R]
MASVTGPGTAEAAAVGPENALEEREQAQDRLVELQKLNGDAMVSVDESTLQSIRKRIENGNISYGRANYADAKKHWQIAREQARAALIRHYARGSDGYLNATADYIDARQSAGYTTAEVARFSERAQQLREEDSTSLSASRNQYRAAKKLNNDVESELPTMTIVDWANRLTPWWVPVSLSAGVLVVVGSGTGFIGYRRGKAAAAQNGSGKQKREKETTRELRGD